MLNGDTNYGVSIRNLKMVLFGIYNVWQASWMARRFDTDRESDLCFSIQREFEPFHKSLKWFYINKVQK